MSIANRCNDIANCKDNSDEINCDLFKIDEDHYRIEYPPLTTSKNPTKIFVNVTLQSVGSFLEIEVLISNDWLRPIS